MPYLLPIPLRIFRKKGKKCSKTVCVNTSSGVFYDFCVFYKLLYKKFPFVI